MEMTRELGRWEQLKTAKCYISGAVLRSRRSTSAQAGARRLPRGLPWRRPAPMRLRDRREPPRRGLQRRDPSYLRPVVRPSKPERLRRRRHLVERPILCHAVIARSLQKLSHVLGSPVCRANFGRRQAGAGAAPLIIFPPPPETCAALIVMCRY